MDKDKAKSTSILSYLSKRGLKPQRHTGKTATFLSPFGKEKVPSMMVDTVKNTFRCYHSGNNGDVISLVMALDNVDFKTALQSLSGDFGNELIKYTPQKVKPVSGVKNTLSIK